MTQVTDMVRYECYQWLLTAMLGVVAWIGLSRMQVRIDLGPIFIMLAIIAGIFGFGLLLRQLARFKKSVVFSGTGVFFCSVAQILTTGAFVMGLQFVAISTEFPLLDQAFARADAAIGFDWHAYSNWLARHPAVKSFFEFAYMQSPVWQVLAILFMDCGKRDGRGSGEFVWCFIVSLLIVNISAIFFPALGYPGEIGQQHIDVMNAARAGAVSDLQGIVTFPSFHAAIGALFIYSVRSFLPLLIIAVPLNAALILATPPFGGHYLVDTIAGLIVAAVTIWLVRKIMNPHKITLPSIVAPVMTAAGSR